MWIILLSLFAFTEVIAGEIDCEKPFPQLCKFPKLLREIPRDVEVFKSQCPEFPLYVKCMRDYDLNCEEEEFRMFQQREKYDKYASVLDEICEEGSALNEVATSKLMCFNETFSNTNCPKELDTFLQPYMPAKPLNGPTPPHAIPERVHCLGQILLAGCVLNDITRNCGIRARRATLEYIHRSGFADSTCSLSSRKSLLDDMNEFNLTEEQKTFAIAELERLKILDDISE